VEVVSEMHYVGLELCLLVINLHIILMSAWVIS